MLKAMVLVSMLLFAQLAAAQALSGTYIVNSAFKDGDKLEFFADSVRYSLKTGCCIVYRHLGTGTYHIVHHKLLIDVKPPIEPEFKIIYSPHIDNNVTRFAITDDKALPVVGASVTGFANGKTTWGCATSLTGLAAIKTTEALKADSIRVAFIGFCTAVFKVSPGYDYQVQLKEGIPFKIEKAIVSNNGKGFKIRIRQKYIQLCFDAAKYCCGPSGNKWVTFVKQ